MTEEQHFEPSDPGTKIRERFEIARNFVCPDCGGKLKYVSATEMHPAHHFLDLARKCTNGDCKYICYRGTERSCVRCGTVFNPPDMRKFETRKEREEFEVRQYVCEECIEKCVQRKS